MASEAKEASASSSQYTNHYRLRLNIPFYLLNRSREVYVHKKVWEDKHACEELIKLLENPGGGRGLNAEMLSGEDKGWYSLRFGIKGRFGYVLMKDGSIVIDVYDPKHKYKLVEAPTYEPGYLEACEEKPLRELNQEQAACVGHINKENNKTYVVLGPPGTGKTVVLNSTVAPRDTGRHAAEESHAAHTRILYLVPTQHLKAKAPRCESVIPMTFDELREMITELLRNKGYTVISKPLESFIKYINPGKGKKKAASAEDNDAKDLYFEIKKALMNGTLSSNDKLKVIYDDYLKRLNQNNQINLALLNINEENLNDLCSKLRENLGVGEDDILNIVVDEAQKLPYGLYLIVQNIGKKTVYAGDPLQGIKEEAHLLQAICNNADLCFELSVLERYSTALQCLYLEIKGLLNIILGGNLLKISKAVKVEGSKPVNSLKLGAVFKTDINSINIADSGAELVIITSDEMAADIRGKYPNNIVLGISEVAGLEFNDIVVDRSLIDRLVEALNKLTDIKDIQIKECLPKNKDFSQEKIEAYNLAVQFILALTRAKTRVFIIGSLFNKIDRQRSAITQWLIDLLEKHAKAIPADFSFAAEDEDNNEEAFLEQAYKYLLQGNRDVAARIYEVAQRKFNIEENFEAWRINLEQSHLEQQEQQTSPQEASALNQIGKIKAWEERQHTSEQKSYATEPTPSQPEKVEAKEKPKPKLYFKQIGKKTPVIIPGSWNQLAEALNSYNDKRELNAFLKRKVDVEIDGTTKEEGLNHVIKRIDRKLLYIFMMTFGSGSLQKLDIKKRDMIYEVVLKNINSNIKEYSKLITEYRILMRDPSEINHYIWLVFCWSLSSLLSKTIPKNTHEKKINFFTNNAYGLIIIDYIQIEQPGLLVSILHSFLEAAYNNPQVQDEICADYLKILGMIKEHFGADFLLEHILEEHSFQTSSGSLLTCSIVSMSLSNLFFFRSLCEYIKENCHHTIEPKDYICNGLPVLCLREQGSLDMLSSNASPEKQAFFEKLKNLASILNIFRIMMDDKYEGLKSAESVGADLISISKIENLGKVFLLLFNPEVNGINLLAQVLQDQNYHYIFGGILLALRTEKFRDIVNSDEIFNFIKAVYETECLLKHKITLLYYICIERNCDLSNFEEYKSYFVSNDVDEFVLMLILYFKNPDIDAYSNTLDMEINVTKDFIDKAQEIFFILMHKVVLPDLEIDNAMWGKIEEQTKFLHAGLFATPNLTYKVLFENLLENTLDDRSVAYTKTLEILRTRYRERPIIRASMFANAANAATTSGRIAATMSDNSASGQDSPLCK